MHRGQIPLDGVGLREFEFLRDVSAKGVRLDNYTAGVTREPSAVSTYELVRELEKGRRAVDGHFKPPRRCRADGSPLIRRLSKAPSCSVRV